MEQATHSSAVFHLRMVTLLSLLWVADVLLIMYAVESILLDGPTVMVMFASEVRQTHEQNNQAVR